MHTPDRLHARPRTVASLFVVLILLPLGGCNTFDTLIKEQNSRINSLQTQLGELEGFAEISATRAVESIQRSKEQPFSRVLFGLNIPQVGFVTAQALEQQGSPSVVQLVKTITAAGAALGEANRSLGAQASGNASINLRGLGPARTLTLMNGRRLADSANAGGGLGANLLFVPSAAVGRIEILMDGAALPARRSRASAPPPRPMSR